MYLFVLSEEKISFQHYNSSTSFTLRIYSSLVSYNHRVRRVKQIEIITMSLYVRLINIIYVHLQTASSMCTP